MAKEAAESRARLHGLGRNERREPKGNPIGGGDVRRRQLGDIAAILEGRPNRRAKTEDLKKENNGSRRVNTSSEDDEPERSLHCGSRDHRIRDEDKEDGVKPRRTGRKGEEDKQTEVTTEHRRHYRRHKSTSRDRGQARDSNRRRRSRSRSPREHRVKETRHRVRSPTRKRSVSLRVDEERPSRPRRHRHSPSSESQDAMKNRITNKDEIKPDYDSDPLDVIIGPRLAPVPQVRSRGRGTLSLGSGIDSRFSASYDPKIDVQLDLDEGNDWDQALEAYRDRQKWNQQGANRLRAAGFTDDQINKWEKGGEKREEDVKWSKPGEGREWDRGKIVDNDGVVSVEPSWGRLKDT